MDMATFETQLKGRIVLDLEQNLNALFQAVC